MFVQERYTLSKSYKDKLRKRTPEFGFGMLGAAVYYRTYSRLKKDGTQEAWADTVIRVVEGVMSILLDWQVKHKLPWEKQKWDDIAVEMAEAIFTMKFLPPGRGLWAMGTPYVYEKGSMALNNCGAVDVQQLSHDSAWAMDALMCGVGVGFSTYNTLGTLHQPLQNVEERFIIPDTREGWVDSVRHLIESYESKDQPQVVFDYSKIRAEGEPIRGFGGTASGPAPLQKAHALIDQTLLDSVHGKHKTSRTITDVMNLIGACVVAGNVRRSAEIALGSPWDDTFLNLKNYELNPERQALGWMSNNSIVIRDYEDLTRLPDIAELVRNNGEPGIFNRINIQKYGRYGEKLADEATLANPCAEIPLEDKELCNLCEVLPTKCVDASGLFNPDVFYNTVALATIYASIVSLLPTHDIETNHVIARNRRIGVSLSGIADWFDVTPTTKIISYLDNGYERVRAMNTQMSRLCGVPISVRVTTVKPSGTVSQLAGVSSGMHYPPFTRYIRRIRVGKYSPVVDILKEANVPYEDDLYSDNTYVFEFPVDQGNTRAQTEVGLFAKASMVAMLQKWWADNMVSNTLTFDPKTEGKQVEDLLAFYTPQVKTLSLLPHTDEGAYPQMPYEGITKTQFDKRAKAISTPDWDKFGGSDGADSRFCTNDACEL